MENISRKDQLIIPGGVAIPGFEMYVATPNGEIYKTWGCIKNPGAPVKQSWRSATKDKYRYRQVGIHPGDESNPNTQPKTCFAHRLICSAFHGPQPQDKPWVNHKDGDKANNKPCNLEWMSVSENIRHAYDTGLIQVKTGEDHWLHGKKASEQARAAMSLKKKGENHPKFKGWWIVGLNQYPSEREAMKAEKITRKKLHEAGVFVYKTIRIDSLPKDGIKKNDPEAPMEILNMAD